MCALRNCVQFLRFNRWSNPPRFGDGKQISYDEGAAYGDAVKECGIAVAARFGFGRHRVRVTFRVDSLLEQFDGFEEKCPIRGQDVAASLPGGLRCWAASSLGTRGGIAK